jgi:hypothetical protein
MSLKCPLKRQDIGKAPVAHACNRSYSGGRNQEDTSLKPAQTKKFTRPTQKTLHKNRAVGVDEGEGPEFQAPVLQKTKQNKTKTKTNYTEADLKQSPKLCYFL